MSTLGLSCNIVGGRIAIHGVVIDADTATEVFIYRAAAGDDLALQLRSLGDALVTRLADLAPAAVIVRTADHHSAARMTDAAALRLRAEGVLLATARVSVMRVASCSGKEIADLCGESKSAVDERAGRMLSSVAAEATAAALAAQQLK